MTGEPITDERLDSWLRIDPSQVWYCKQCKGFHTPDWNCSCSYVIRCDKFDCFKKLEIEQKVKDIMIERGICDKNVQENKNNKS